MFSIFRLFYSISWICSCCHEYMYIHFREHDLIVDFRAQRFLDRLWCSAIMMMKLSEGRYTLSMCGISMHGMSGCLKHSRIRISNSPQPCSWISKGGFAMPELLYLYIELGFQMMNAARTPLYLTSSLGPRYLPLARRQSICACWRYLFSFPSKRPLNRRRMGMKFTLVRSYLYYTSTLYNKYIQIINHEGCSFEKQSWRSFYPDTWWIFATTISPFTFPPCFWSEFAIFMLKVFIITMRFFFQSFW